MYRITKQFAFEAAHQLYGLPEDHQCSRLHGHSYRVEVELRSIELNDAGFIVDYGELKPLKEFLDDVFDHRFLNEVLAELTEDPEFQTSAENMSKFLYRWCKKKWPETYAVRLSETAKTWAEYCEG